MKGIFQHFKRKSISDKKGLPDKDDKFIPDELTLKKMGEKRISPLNDPVWKACLLVVAGSFLLGLSRLLIGISHPVSSWFIALISLLIWGLAIKLLLWMLC